ncbi:MAG: hypothetical protein IJN21_10445 [Clostridia bacterium]|nr:hypothetical protein [Clostridia bacterium]
MKMPISDTRKRYIVRLFARIAILIACVLAYAFDWIRFDILEGDGFFKRVSILHALWFVWVMDMVFQLLPAKNIALGSQKLFKTRFRPVLDKINVQALKNYIVSTTKAAYKVFILWGALIAALGSLRHFGVLKDVHLFLVSVLFYVCDLICVLVWCPFRLIMKNKCCTTCRIFNWDHLMMFTPMLFVKSFYSYSLILLAVGVFAVWEICVFLYPERFWESSNMALKCSECTDKLCTQYCRKLRQAK